MARVVWSVAAAAAILLASADRGDAAEGRIPISAATTITVSGSYFLSQDIENLDADGTTRIDAITINADHVTVDLDSHTIKVVDAFAGIVSEGILAGTDVEVRNGKIFAITGDGTDGVRFQRPGGQFRVRDLSITGFQGSGIKALGVCGVGSARIIAVGNTVQGVIGGAQSSTAGIYAQCMEASRIEQNDMRESWVGIWLEQTSDTIVANNVVSQNFDDGILLANGGNNNSVERNTVTSNVGIGIHLYGSSANSIVHNNASKNGFSGISLDGPAVCHFNQVSYNTTSFNGWNLGGNGIHLAEFASYNSLAWNQTSGNSGNGIYIAGSNNNSLDWNQASGNSDAGIRIALPGAGNIYSNNRANANTNGDYVDGGGNDNVIILTGTAAGNSLLDSPTNR